MSFSKAVVFVSLAAPFFVVPLAHADNDKNWEGEAELGVLTSSGNTDETNINSGLILTHEGVTWRNKGDFSTAYSKTDDETTAEEYRAALETNYKFDEKQYWFLRGSYEKDRFTGYEFESTVTTGYGSRLWNSGKRSFLDLSIGAGYRYNKLEERSSDGEDTEKETIGRLAGQFNFALSDNALFRQKLSSEIGLDENNVISQSETAVQANIVGNLSLKAAYRVKHVSDAPAGTEKTDTETSISLLYGF
jgi:putative salt-induced outer membrane protein YdiY